MRCRIGCAFIKRHCDGRIQIILYLHGAFGRQFEALAVDMGFEGNAIFVNFAQFIQRHYLKPATVGQDRTRPVHKFMQAAEALHPL